MFVSVKITRNLFTNGESRNFPNPKRMQPANTVRCLLLKLYSGVKVICGLNLSQVIYDFIVL